VRGTSNFFIFIFPASPVLETAAATTNMTPNSWNYISVENVASISVFTHFVTGKNLIRKLKSNEQAIVLFDIKLQEAQAIGLTSK